MKILKTKFMFQNPNLSANRIINLAKIIFKTIIFKYIEENVFLLTLLE